MPKHINMIMALIFAFVFCAGCHSGGGSGSAEESFAVGAVDPYAGTWSGLWNYSTSNGDMSLQIQLTSLGHNQYSGTATTIKGGKTQQGPLTAIFTDVVKPVMAITIKWQGTYEETVLEGNVTKGTANIIMSGSVDHFVGSDLYTGTFSISKSN